MLRRMRRPEREKEDKVYRLNKIPIRKVDTNADCAVIITCPRGAQLVRFFEFCQCFWIFPLLSPPPFKFLNHSYVRQASNWWKYVLKVQCVFKNISPFFFLLFTLVYSTTCILLNIVRLNCITRLSWFQFLSQKDLILIEKHIFSIHVRDYHTQKILGLLILNIIFLCLCVFISKSYNLIDCKS